MLFLSTACAIDPHPERQGRTGKLLHPFHQPGALLWAFTCQLATPTHAAAALCLPQFIDQHGTSPGQIKFWVVNNSGGTIMGGDGAPFTIAVATLGTFS